MKMGCISLLLFTIACVTAEQYKGYHTVSVGPLATHDDVSIVESLIDEDERLQQVVLVSEFPYIHGTVILLVAPDRIQSVEDALTMSGINHVLQDTDQARTLQKSENDNRRAQMSWRRRRTQTAPDFFMNGDQMNDWLSMMAASYPEFVQYNEIGTSWEGRPITGVIINDTTVPDPYHVFIHAGIHAREWLTHATLIYIINEVITSRSEEAQAMRERYIWHLYPNVNPDGYHVTHTSDRYWRKNTRVNLESECKGVDLNRNWGMQFGGEGSSNNTCSEIYHGTEAFSEPETQAIRDALIGIGTENILMYVDLHSYSQVLLLPYGSIEEKPFDYEDQKAVGDAFAEAINKTQGTEFEVGTPPDLMYLASGGTIDWVQDSLGVKYAITPELRPNPMEESYGFVAPPSVILPSGQEIFAGIVAALAEAVRRGK